MNTQMDAEEKLFPGSLSEAIRTALADMPVACILGPSSKEASGTSATNLLTFLE